MMIEHSGREAAPQRVAPDHYLGREGRVHARESNGERISVVCADGSVIARRALSCLVEPEPGDRVLVAAAAGGEQHFVLAVLERDSTRPVELTVEQALVLRSKSSSVELNAPRICLTSAETELASAKLSITAAKAEVVTHALHWLAARAELDVGRGRLVAQVAESVVDRLSQTFGRVYRKIEEFEHVRAKRIDQEAELMNLRGKNALVTAEQLVKLDGEQVHLG